MTSYYNCLWRRSCHFKRQNFFIHFWHALVPPTLKQLPPPMYTATYCLTRAQTAPNLKESKFFFCSQRMHHLNYDVEVYDIADNFMLLCKSDIISVNSKLEGEEQKISIYQNYLFDECEKNCWLTVTLLVRHCSSMNFNKLFTKVFVCDKQSATNFLRWFWWQLLSAGRNLKLAPCEEVEANALTQIALRRSTHRSWVVHTTFQQRGWHYATELYLPSFACWFSIHTL